MGPEEAVSRIGNIAADRSGQAGKQKRRPPRTENGACPYEMCLAATPGDGCGW
jgi:hypothetical protein